MLPLFKLEADWPSGKNGAQGLSLLETANPLSNTKFLQALRSWFPWLLFAAM